MIIRTDDMKDICSKILFAVDTSDVSRISDIIELKTINNNLVLGITNQTYYVEVSLNLDEQLDFHATVNAITFLKLISQITTEAIEFTTTKTNLIISANGKYKLPLIFEDDHMMSIPKIDINNVTSNFNVNSTILNDMLVYNGKQLNKKAAAQPVQMMYYLDNHGCVTFTNVACINNFELAAPIKILLNSKVVKLFKLFKNCDVGVILGHDALDTGIIQTKIRFIGSNIEITAVLNSDDNLLNTVPAQLLRSIANGVFDYNVNINKDLFIQAINRLMTLRADNDLNYNKFEFTNNYVNIYSSDCSSVETISYETTLKMPDDYISYFDIFDFKTALEAFSEKYLSLSFGSNHACVISNSSIKNIIQECLDDE